MSRLRQLAEKYKKELSGHPDSPDTYSLSGPDSKLETHYIPISYGVRKGVRILSNYCPTVKLTAEAMTRLSDNSDNSDASSTPDISDIPDIASKRHNNDNNINILARLGPSVRIGQSEGVGRPEAEYRTALAAFKTRRPPGVTRPRHDQACWAAQMFLNEWSSLAAELEWTTGDIFDSPRAIRGGGLAYWLGTDIVTAVGPDHAVTETDRIFDRVTRQTWINPYAAEITQ